MEALADCDRALALKPDFPAVLFACVHAAIDLNLYDEAIADVEKLLALSPDYDFGLGMLLPAKRGACDWSTFATDTAAAVQAVRDGKRAIPPFMFFAISESPADQLQCAKNFLRGLRPPSGKRYWTVERYSSRQDSRGLSVGRFPRAPRRASVRRTVRGA